MIKRALLILLTATLLLLCACGDDKSESETESIGGNTELLPNFGDDVESGADGNGKLPQYAEVSTDAAKAALALVSDSFDKDSTEELAEGLSIRTLSFGDAKAYILTADLGKYSIKVSTPYGLKPDGTMQSLNGQNELANKNGTKAVAAIAANPTDRATCIPKGLIISGGELIYNIKGNDGSVFFGLYKDGTPFACTYGEYGDIYRNKVTEMVSATHIIAKDGKVLEIAGTIYEEKTFRTGGGFSADGSNLCFVYGENIDIKQLSNLLIGSGCSVAVNFNNGEELGLLCGDTLYGANVSVGPAVLITEK